MLTISAQGPAVGQLHLPFPGRLANAVLSYCQYLVKTIWPAKLVVLYPFSPDFAIGDLVIAVLALGCLTFLAIRCARRAPYVFTGWFWFLGTLLPVIGLIQVGFQSMADRYTYVPLIGLFIIVAWGGYDLAGRWRIRPATLAALAALPVLGCIPVTRAQLVHWQDSVALFQHALRWTTRNFIAENNLGIALLDRGQLDDAYRHLANAVSINPEYADALSNLGLVLVTQGKIDEGINCYRAAIRKQPADAEVHHNLGCALVRKGEWDEATKEFESALRFDPERSAFRADLARALSDQGRFSEAGAHWTTLLRREPDNPDVQASLGLVLAAEKDFPAALSHLQEAARLRPNDAEIRLRLGDVLAEAGMPEQARQQYLLAFAPTPRPDLPAVFIGRARTLAAQSNLAAAAVSYRTALSYDAELPAAHYELGVMLSQQGRLAEAGEELQRVLQLSANHWEAREWLGFVWLSQGKTEAAWLQLSEAARINPTNALVRFHLALVLDRLGRSKEAVAQYQQALALDPRMPAALNNLAWILASDPDPEIRNGIEAVRLAEQACQLTGYQDPRLVTTLGAAYAESGRFAEAAAAAEKARTRALESENREVAAENEQLLKLYRSGRAYHEAPGEPAGTAPR